jgi:hypothetical protein
MNALALHGMIFARRIAVEILPTHFPVFPPNVAVSEQRNVVVPAKAEYRVNPRNDQWTRKRTVLQWE